MDVGSSGTENLIGTEECIHGTINGTLFDSLNTSVSEGAIIPYNSTDYCLEHAPTLTNAAITRVIVLSIIAFFSLLGNLATIYSIRKSQRIRRFSRTSCSAIYALILHLSIADLLVTVFCLTGEAAWSYTVAWLAGNIACKLFKFSQMFSLYLSTFIMVLVGVDRFVAVRYPMKNLSTGSRGTKVIILMWILSALFSAPQLFIFHVMKGPFIEEFHQCVTHGSYTADWQEKLYALFSLFFMFILPLIILIITYASTFLTIAESEKVFQSEVSGRRPDLNRRRLIHRAKMKSLRISVVIVVAFVVWWTPYYTMMIIFIFLEPDKHLSEDLQSAIFFFGMSNSLVNPIIYGAFQLWPGRHRRGSTSRDFSSSTRVTQASTYRSSTRIGDRNTRTNRDSENQDTSALVSIDKNQIVNSSSSSHGNTMQMEVMHQNGVSSAQLEHTLLCAPSNGAVTRV